jgi:hypothetical protein
MRILTFVDEFNKNVPVGIKDMPMMSKAIISLKGDMIGLHPPSFCCRKADSIHTYIQVHKNE